VAITVSGLYVDIYVRQLKQQAWTGTGGLDHTLATWKIYLLNNSATPNFSTASQAYSATNEVNGTGWAAGGVLLSAAAAGATSVVPTLAEGTAGAIRYDHTNDVSVASTTLTNARAAVIYADNITAPTADPLVVLINFGADYSTVAGTLGIQWSATGIFELDVTP
jgi:hypothetical protein